MEAVLLTSLVKLINNLQIWQPDMSFSLFLTLPLFLFLISFVFVFRWNWDGLWLICFGWVHLGVLNNILVGCGWMSHWELEHSLVADDVTIVGLLLVFQFEEYPTNLTKSLIDLKSQVASIIYNQVRLITIKMPSFFSFW